MRIKLTPYAQREWVKLVGSDRKLARKVEKLLREVSSDSSLGRGKAEPLKYELTNCWSRWINRKDRLVYRVNEEPGVAKVLSMLSHCGQHSMESAK